MQDLTPNSIGGHTVSNETTKLFDLLDLADRYRVKAKIFAKTLVVDELEAKAERLEEEAADMLRKDRADAVTYGGADWIGRTRSRTLPGRS